MKDSQIKQYASQLATKYQRPTKQTVWRCFIYHTKWEKALQSLMTDFKALWFLEHLTGPPVKNVEGKIR